MTDAQFNELRSLLTQGLSRIEALETEHRQLVAYLGQKFDAIDRRFEALEARFEALEARFEALEARFGALEQRVTKSEVGQESLRDEVRAVAEGVQTVAARLDRFQAETMERFDRVEYRLMLLEAA